MAYVDFSSELMPATAAVAPRADPTPATERLTALEWSVVALARRDRLSSLAAPGPVSIALGKVFGTRRHNPHLADPKLEALRRLSVLTWHRGFAIPGFEVTAFLNAGFSPAQYEALTASIGVARDGRAVRG
ncbi:hypothetical protein ASE86_11105 [Sphingomonas sp. Leaf33]|uniref:hypothetical protein n=1 Tax=Sphingomonas sp. Leaf33 TaxID=1736215 RepID=UPI0006FFC79F|nr:hypothetical protein [Sphingomonas sp. Leaf33]KQN26616.1 hypothetical protein ASE86_11105 [Sphingomonas sp. Leaf33]